MDKVGPLSTYVSMHIIIIIAGSDQELTSIGNIRFYAVNSNPLYEGSDYSNPRMWLLLTASHFPACYQSGMGVFHEGGCRSWRGYPQERPDTATVVASS